MGKTQLETPHAAFSLPFPLTRTGISIIRLPNVLGVGMRLWKMVMSQKSPGRLQWGNHCVAVKNGELDLPGVSGCGRVRKEKCRNISASLNS